MGASEFFQGGSLSGKASGAVTGLTFVKQVTTANEAFLFALAGVGDTPIGVAADTVATTEDVTVFPVGTVGRMLVDGNAGTIAAGDYLKPNALGYGVKGSAGNVVGAIALEPSTAAGDIIDVLVIQPQVVGTPAAGAITGVYTDADGTAAITATHLLRDYTPVILSYAGAVACSIPATASANDGHIVIIRRTGAGLVTITPASGTIGGESTNVSLTAAGQTLILVSDLANTDWKILYLSTPNTFYTDADGTAVITATHLQDKVVPVVLSYAGAVGLSIPATTAENNGHLVVIKRTGAGTVTITPVSGTVGGASTNTDMTLAGDYMILASDFDNTDWKVIHSSVTDQPGYATDATGTVTLTAALLRAAGWNYTLTCSAAGATTVNMAAVATLPVGTKVTIRKTGSYGAITVEGNASEQVNGAANDATTLLMIGDWATYQSNGSAWILVASGVTVPSACVTSSGSTIVVTEAQLAGGKFTAIASAAGTQAVTLAAAATCRQGTLFILYKTGSTGAVTITPTAGTVAGGATDAAADAQYDNAVYVASGTDWVKIPVALGTV
jgi:hypothetical protein